MTSSTATCTLLLSKFPAETRWALQRIQLCFASDTVVLKERYQPLKHKENGKGGNKGKGYVPFRYRATGATRN